ncbi:hypothetical protein PAAG_12237 [Paracoccidioides lutzii Pb01]|uniref:Uncharacterized protein n=1 Tax=Paracoccidioides lutzii (strain ATCC MYA-826 / Pb01) TaxID=502779 RepID=A0A0A2VJQ9_PARBA|nr:hypothetical protein PAAG_12237 [Paracoccidioides lutzii Pb01]KGQ01109.1 hypothetical protein PAAG_12237 [Paracoccidioides lutzii Pb01]
MEKSQRYFGILDSTGWQSAAATPSGVSQNTMHTGPAWAWGAGSLSANLPKQRSHKRRRIGEEERRKAGQGRFLRCFNHYSRKSPGQSSNAPEYGSSMFG